MNWPSSFPRPGCWWMACVVITLVDLFVDRSERGVTSG
jgi:hypothetical protein